ncbi:peptidylprolyl isomerase [Halolamina sp.]|uniref:FKBP-type peptidyl-prolyl cis-trans isomerase n=1 Tax=Halolamina sp. TaxID=1940283 RepID=UPI000223B4FA|nr:peptidylprolyl isomerase FKBP-type [halophilic archaeon DL31]
MVDPGSIAIVHLTGRLVDGADAGAVFETTDVDVALEEGIYHDHRDFKPLEFRVGEGHVLSGIDSALRRMVEGETQTIVLGPDEAYGTRDERDVVSALREEIEARSGKTPEIDDLVRSDTGDVGWVSDVSAETVTVDFNNELAGERVEFEIRLLEVHATEAGHDVGVSRDGVA